MRLLYERHAPWLSVAGMLVGLTVVNPFARWSDPVPLQVAHGCLWLSRGGGVGGSP